MLDLKNYKVILASKSPRRQQLLKGMDIDFDVLVKDVDESFPNSLKGKDIALMLSERKAMAFAADELPENFLLITADTIVLVDDDVLNKPADSHEAFNMLKTLSGREHNVVTAVTLRTDKQLRSFFELSAVRFGALSDEEIVWYVHRYMPLDKAGAYGIQEWIGYVAIASVKGSFFNVMGLPTHRLFMELKKFAGTEV
ncbi:MAG: Maf family nucleotide pyrophosphatase [Bacteroidales bacterium]|nr:Maf family nucleotide pyrophosphatase [Bacteroidales bacterium]